MDPSLAAAFARRKGATASPDDEPSRAVPAADFLAAAKKGNVRLVQDALKGGGSALDPRLRQLIFSADPTPHAAQKNEALPLRFSISIFGFASSITQLGPTRRAQRPQGAGAVAEIGASCLCVLLRQVSPSGFRF